jgi:hypothetical protein
MGVRAWLAGLDHYEQRAPIVAGLGAAGLCLDKIEPTKTEGTIRRLRTWHDSLLSWVRDPANRRNLPPSLEWRLWPESVEHSEGFIASPQWLLRLAVAVLNPDERVDQVNLAIVAAIQDFEDGSGDGIWVTARKAVQAWALGET